MGVVTIIIRVWWRDILNMSFLGLVVRWNAINLLSKHKNLQQSPMPISNVPHIKLSKNLKL